MSYLDYSWKDKIRGIKVSILIETDRLRDNLEYADAGDWTSVDIGELGGSIEYFKYLADTLRALIEDYEALTSPSEPVGTVGNSMTTLEGPCTPRGPGVLLGDLMP